MTTAHDKKYYYKGTFAKKRHYSVFQQMYLFVLHLYKQDQEAVLTSFMDWLNTNTSLNQGCTLQAQSSVKLIPFVTPLEKTNTEYCFEVMLEHTNL